MIIISIDSLFIYKEKHLQVYLDECGYEFLMKQIAMYPDYDLLNLSKTLIHILELQMKTLLCSLC